jgi:hypothetical protein
MPTATTRARRQPASAPKPITPANARTGAVITPATAPTLAAQTVKRFVTR